MFMPIELAMHTYIDRSLNKCKFILVASLIRFYELFKEFIATCSKPIPCDRSLSNHVIVWSFEINVISFPISSQHLDGMKLVYKF